MRDDDGTDTQCNPRESATLTLLYASARFGWRLLACSAAADPLDSDRTLSVLLRCRFSRLLYPVRDR